MEIIFNQNTSPSPIISIILLDWSIRESFHILYYLSDQTIPREQYEVIWIEYYNKHAHELEAGIEEGKKLGIPPIVDKWIVMDMPRNIYYHKHLMYNIGTLVTRGKIVTFCDSDAIVKPTFIENIIKSFDEDPNIVLHMDEARNNDKRFYPFNYPSVEEVIGEGVINWKDGKTTGMLDRVDPHHTRNYGACMSALREDFINIGGADEHIDYLGHICGPYEMTFRLVNAGKKEVWHQEEFLYHVWHPGQAGHGNYLGPHDGKHMSTTALKTRYTKRILPLTENPAIRMLRLESDGAGWELLKRLAFSNEEMMDWKIEEFEKREDILLRLKNIFVEPKVKLRLRILLFQILLGQVIERTMESLVESHSIRDILWKVFKSPNYLRNMDRNNSSILKRCKKGIRELKLNNINEVAIYGDGYVSKIVCVLALNSAIRIEGVYGKDSSRKFMGFKIRPFEALKNYDGNIILTLEGLENEVMQLKEIGVRGEQIILI